ncbi:MAG TPA: DegT/DnrJ/EryC1/StrS family aminotransferase [Gaiellaceae bacterium]|nr:DegT/DnrJ/EryC1/StrS family aminotransferase [Gaiellaceae bacterium]
MTSRRSERATAPAWSVPLSDLEIGPDHVDAVTDTLRSGWWSMGPRVAELEAAFSQLTATEHAFAVANGTAALQLALLAVGCGPGDEVVLPSLNFVAAANAVVHTGASPVFCDILGPRDLNLDPDDVAAAVTPRTKAVIVLHYGGFPCDAGAVRELADRHGLAIVEDAAHAVGATHLGRPCGSLGDVGCFSFFSNKNLPVGEGGMVVTDDAGIAERLRLLRSHGMTTLTWDRHRGHAAGYDVLMPGFNYRLDELHAALALVQLGLLAGRNDARRAAARRYREALDGVAGLTVPFHEEGDSSHHLAVVLLPEGVRRDVVREALAAERIQTSVHYPPIHGFTAYADRNGRLLPRTEDVADRILTLPLFPHIAEEQVALVADTLVAAVEEQALAAD